LRLLCWNTNRGRGTDAALVLAEESGADIVFLQETVPPPQWGSARVGDVVPGNAWGSWVLSRAGQITPLVLPGYSGWTAGGLLQGLSGADDPICVFSIHSPTHTKYAPRKKYVYESRRIVQEIAALAPDGCRVIIAGDFNITLGERTASEGIALSTAESRTLAEYRDLGFMIAWRDSRPHDPLAQTLRWTKDRTKPFHCDGYLVRGFVAAEVECAVLEGESFTSMSDHNPVVCELNVPAVQPGT